MIVVITGPTCVGKTKLSVLLAHQLGGEVINADSTQVYKGMDIATAKVTEEEKENVPHHLFDIKNIKEDYSVYDYQKDARACIDDILSRGKVPILVGGTGLYIKSALYDFEFTEEENYDYSMYSDTELYQQLVTVDSTTTIHPNNRKRVERALSYFKNHNEPMSEKEESTKLVYDNVVFIGLTTDREILYDKINHRVDVMVENGLMEEARNIFESNIRSKAVTTPIGYKELFPYFEQKRELTDCLEEIKKNSRHYAKRQFTYFRHQLPVIWFSVNYDDFDKTIEEVYTYLTK